MSLFTRYVAPLGLGILGLTYSSAAFAKDAVVIPLYSPNLNSQKIGNITSLITSEVDFAGRYDMVSQAESRPSSLTPKCLKSVSCLKAIASKEGTDAMITGSITKKGDALEFFLVQYENGKIIRMKRFQIEDNPLAVAADVGGPIQALITGKEEASGEDDFSDSVNENDYLEEEGDIFGGSGMGGIANATNVGDNSAAEEESRRKAEEQENIRKMEEEALRLAAEQQRMEEEALRLATETNKKEEDFDFSFAPSTVEVVNENARNSGITDEEELSINLNSDNARSKNQERNRDPAPVDFERDSRKTSNRASTKIKSPGKTSHIDATASVMGKVGASNFQGMNFVTYGGEIGIHLTDWVAITIAGEGYATQQTTPILDEDGEPTDDYTQEWRVILPIGTGALVHFPGKIAKPYAGVELQIIPSYVEEGSGMAFGLRGRAGSNFMLTEAFGFNLNLAAGFWSGEQFTYIQNTTTGSPLLSTGFLPQLSVGTIIAF